MEIKINYKPLEFKQCNGQIVYKDGTTEPIISKREFYDECEVRTPSGQYICFSRIVTGSNGYKFKIYRFGRFDFDKYEYFIVDTIKEFQIMEENKKMTSKELHVNTIIPLREQLRKAEEEYEKLYRKEKAEENGLKRADCDSCAYSCVLRIDDHNECLGGKCTCCHDFCYKWIPETKVSAWLRENHEYDTDLVYRLEDMFGDDFLKCDDVDIVLKAIQLIEEVEEKAKENANA